MWYYLLYIYYRSILIFSNVQSVSFISFCNTKLKLELIANLWLETTLIGYRWLIKGNDSRDSPAVQWRLNRIPRSISRNGRDREASFRGEEFHWTVLCPRQRSVAVRNRQGNVCRMWQDMASGAAQFAELVWRVLPRNRMYSWYTANV